MAKRDPKKYYDWPDGKAHSIPYAQHKINMRNKAGNPMTLPPPPVGTYDPAIDYNASAAQRGYDQYAGDAQTLFERGQQDYDLGLGDLTRGRDYSLEDLRVGNERSNIDYNNATAGLGRQYGILGRRQAEGAARQGITSEGLLARSQAVRAENQGRDQGILDLGIKRATEDYNTGVNRTNAGFAQGKTRLDLGQAREFGGFNGQQMLNPLTGQPEFGNLFTSLTRAGGENVAYQREMDDTAARQAAARGYVSPLTQAPRGDGGTYIGATKVTPQMYQNGLLLEAMLEGSRMQQSPRYQFQQSQQAGQAAQRAATRRARRR